MTKTLKQHQKEIGVKGGSATLKKHGREHYQKMRAYAGAKMYFQGMLDGITISGGKQNYTSLIVKALQDKNYAQLQDHRILGKFYK